MTLTTRIAWIIVSLFIAVPTLILGLLATTWGSSVAVQLALKVSPVAIQYERFEGSLLTQFTVHNLAIKMPEQLITVDEVSLDWSLLALTDPKLKINQVGINQLAITLQPPEQQSNSHTASFTGFTTPLPILLERLDVKALTLSTGAEPNYQVFDIVLAAEFTQDELTLQNLAARYDAFTLNSELAINLNDQLPFSINATINGESSVNLVLATTGNIDQVNLNGELTIADSPAQTFNGSINNLQSQLAPQGQIQINQLSLLSINNALIDLGYQPIEIAHTNQLVVHGSLDFSAQEITTDSFELFGLEGLDRGPIRLSGSITSWLTALNKPELAELKLQLTGPLFDLSHYVGIEEFRAYDLAGQVAGTVNDYRFNFNAQFEQPSSLLDTTHAYVSLAGFGNQNSARLETFEIRHPQVKAMGKADLNWRENIALDAQLSQLEVTAQSYQLTSSGAITLTDDVINIPGLQGVVNQTQFNLAGNFSLNPERSVSGLELSVMVPTLADLSTNADDILHKLDGELATKLLINGDMDEVTALMTELNYRNDELGTWQLLEATELKFNIAQRLLTTELICLNRSSRWQASNPTALCLSSETVRDEQHLVLIGQELPLFLLNRFRADDVRERISGRVDIRATAAINPQDLSLLYTEGDVFSDSTRLSALDDGVESKIEFWQLNWRGHQELLTTEFLLQLPEQQGAIVGDISIEQLEQIEGNVLVGLYDLSLLQWWLPDINTIRPRAVGEINITGSVSEPSIAGQFEVAADEMGLSNSGIVLTDLRFSISDQEGFADQFLLDGQASTGDGWLALEGAIEPLNKSLRLNINGSNFVALNTPNLNVVVDPQIALTATADRVDIKGSVHIPTARIGTPELTSVTRPSADVVIYENNVPLFEEDHQLYPVYADIELSLGNDVVIDAYGFTGNVAGRLQLNEAPEKALTAAGSIEVAQGKYEIYGQELQIDRGKLVYNGGPINNPGLDLRVVRQAASLVPGEDVSVGAQVGGSLATPQLRLFSTPTMPESSILSYLLLGRGPGAGSDNDNMKLQALLALGSQGTDIIGNEFKQAFGLDEFGIDSTRDPRDTSFYIGKYLSPRLYVKYGVGLFENTNTFFIQYKLTEHFLIESSTSGEAQGGDIFYTIEK